MRATLALAPAFALATVLLLPGCAGMMGGGGPKPYAIFFTERSSALEPAAVEVIAAAAAAAKAAPATGVLVLGHTDSTLSKQDDIVLSQQRARRVSDALVADGLDTARITQRGRGQTGEDPGVESRRVDISLTN